MESQRNDLHLMFCEYKMPFPFWQDYNPYLQLLLQPPSQLPFPDNQDSNIHQRIVRHLKVALIFFHPFLFPSFLNFVLTHNFAHFVLCTAYPKSGYFAIRNGSKECSINLCLPVWRACCLKAHMNLLYVILFFC